MVSRTQPFINALRQASATLAHRLLDSRWGARSLVCLYVSVLSGILLALQYDAAEPFYSTTTIELIIPFGGFWRGLHYFSSQLFFLLLLLHFAAILWKNEATFRPWPWVRLTLSLPVALLLLFTGYVLRGDATGEAAGAIAEHIALSIPLLGAPLNALLFDVLHAGVRKVYTHHLIGLMVLGGVCVWPHLRRYTASPLRYPGLLCLLTLLSIILPTPVEADRFGLLHIAGPWFFLGLQELLHYLPVFWAGVVLPSLPVATACLLYPETPQRKGLLRLLCGWLAGYGILSWISYGRIFS